MKVIQLLSFLFLNIIHLTYAKPARTEVLGRSYKVIIWSCESSISEYTFDYGYDVGTGESYYSLLCGFDPVVASLFICAANKFGAYSSDFNSTAKYFSTICSDYDGLEYTTDELYNIYENGTDYAVEIEYGRNYTETVFYTPIVVNMTDVDATYYYYKDIDYNFDMPSTFAGIMYLYFVLVFVLYGFSTLIKRIGYQRSLNNKFVNWYRANISIPSLFNGKHTESWVTLKVISTLVPTRAESLVVFFFICLNVLLTCVNYDFTHAAYGLVTMKYEAIGDRTGLLSFGLIPLLIIFAGRNNFLTTITGIPYTSFIFYHKWVARVMFIHALIHSICWTGYGLYYGYLAYYASETYWRWGIVATTLGGLICFQAFHYLRNISYETFLIIHIVLVALFIVGCWYHCYDLGWLEWIYVSWAVWIIERLFRAFRISIFGIKTATITYVGDQTFKVVVPHNKFFDPFPGSYAFIYFMTPLLFWQAHPFTILSSVVEDNHLAFYIKTKTGITRNIKRRLEKSQDGTVRMKVAIEGPYGHRAPIEKYDKALLYAGGNGIPGLFQHAMDLSSRESSSKQVLKLLWVVRNYEALSWFSDELKTLANRSNVEVDIYITGRTPIQTASSSEKKDTSSESSDIEKTQLEHGQELVSAFDGRFKFHDQRPDVDSLILKEFTEESGPSIAVMSCGAPKMVDQIRASVANHLQKSKGRVDLFEELQVW